MSNYVKSTDFAAKDALASGNAGKIVKGTEIDTEFNNIATAVATKADLASPTFTGTVAAGTANITTLTASTATISGGTITGITDLAVADGGTGASTAANARSNLGTVSDTASNGIAARTAANTLTARTITAGTGITVADGDGVSGNPTITNAGVTSINGNTGAISVPVLTRGTSQGASGTAVDFTSIPSTAKRITLMFSGVSKSGVSAYLIQIGTSSGIETTGYVSAGSGFDTVVGTSSYTNGYGLRIGSSTYVVSGVITIANITGDTWVASYSLGSSSGTATWVGGGTKTVLGTLDRVRITSSAGGDTFSAGTFNIFYE
jgi:hypothetical protein